MIIIIVAGVVIGWTIAKVRAQRRALRARSAMPKRKASAPAPVAKRLR